MLAQRQEQRPPLQKENNASLICSYNVLDGRIMHCFLFRRNEGLRHSSLASGIFKHGVTSDRGWEERKDPTRLILCGTHSPKSRQIDRVPANQIRNLPSPTSTTRRFPSSRST